VTDRTTGSRMSGPPWAFLATIAGVVVLAAAVLVVPGLLAPGPSAGPSAASSPDAHVLATDQGVFTIAYVDGAIIVSRVGQATVELGRGVVPDVMRPRSSGGTLSGGGVWVLACPPTADERIRVLFGAQYPIDGFRYVGPAAATAFAPDGLWLVVLEPGQLDPAAQIRIETRGGSSSVDATGFDEALADGVVQPSGCRVLS
jgi:hypothetical protein